MADQGVTTRSQSSSSREDQEVTTPMSNDSSASESGVTHIPMTLSPEYEEEVERRVQAALLQRTASAASSSVRLEPPTPTNERPAILQAASLLETPSHVENEPPVQAATSQHLFVDEKKYRITSQDVINGVTACKIGPNTTDTKKKIKIFQDYLKSAGLYTMIMGTRKIPLCSENNPHGYVPRRSLIMNDPSTVQNHDDFYHWAYDSQRGFMLCMIFFDTKLHYHATQEILRCNGVLMYSQIMSIVDGTYLRDIEKARKALYVEFAISPTIPIAQELDRLQTLISDFEYAQEASLSEKQKMDLLSSHVLKDPRPIIVAALLTARSLSKTYEQSKQEIIVTCNDLPPGIATIRMANLNVASNDKEKPSQYCFGYAQGNCRFKEKCRFKHEIDPAAKNVPGRKEARIKNNVKPHEKDKKKERDYSNVRLAQAHLQLVGPPRGKPVPLNDKGYSNRQKEQINLILALNPEPTPDPNPPAAAFSSWGSPDMMSYMRSDNHDDSKVYINSLRMKPCTPRRKCKMRSKF